MATSKRSHRHRRFKLQCALNREIHRLEVLLADIEQEKNNPDRVEVYFRLGKNSKSDQDQLKGNGRFTGLVRKNGSMIELVDTEVIFVATPPFILLDDEPFPGERWACRVTYFLGDWFDGTPMIGVEPKVRMDCELEAKRNLLILLDRLKDLNRGSVRKQSCG